MNQDSSKFNNAKVSGFTGKLYSAEYGISELQNKQISPLTIFHYRRLYCIIIQVVSMIFPVLKR